MLSRHNEYKIKLLMKDKLPITADSERNHINFSFSFDIIRQLKLFRLCLLIGNIITIMLSILNRK